MDFKFFNNGVHEGYNQIESKRIVIANYTIIISFLLSIFFGLVFFIENIKPLNYIFLGFTIIHFFNWRINFYGYNRVAKVILYFSLLLQVLLMSMNIGKSVDLKVFYIPIAIIPFLVFGKKEKLLFYISLVFTVLNIACIYTFDKLYITFATTNSLSSSQLINNAFNLTALFCMIFLAFLFLSLSELGETLLLVKNKQLHIQKEQLELNKSELERLNGLKDRLLSILSHDLRNPFDNISSLTDLILDNSLTKEEIQIIAIKHKESTILTRQLLENLLAWSHSQLADGEVRMSKVYIRALLEKIQSQLSYIIINKNLTVDIQVDYKTCVYADPDMLEIIFRNLIMNAIKFSHKDQKIVIYSKSDKDKIFIIVEDYGIGIPEEIMKGLFEINLGKIRYGTKLEKGSGIGLHICKQLTEANNGKIYVESEVGAATKFTLELMGMED
jgi:signal transduction histidine kinase